jgi:hypothetical protein
MKLVSHPKAQIISIVEGMRAKSMNSACHGFDEKIVGESIGQASERALLSLGKAKNAPIAVMSVVLAANRNYNSQVKKQIEAIKENPAYRSMKFDQLHQLMQRMDFVKFGTVWKHKDQKKYDTLKAIVRAVLKFRKRYTDLSDLALMRKWAKQADLGGREKDILGMIPNVGIATFQHMRMTFGVDTVKPDQRVNEVLSREFSLKLTGMKAIQAVQEIAAHAGRPAYEVDQIFVKYGSGGYC